MKNSYFLGAVLFLASGQVAFCAKPNKSVVEIVKPKIPARLQIDGVSWVEREEMVAASTVPAHAHRYAYSDSYLSQDANPQYYGDILHTENNQWREGICRVCGRWVREEEVYTWHLIPESDPEKTEFEVYVASFGAKGK